MLVVMELHRLCIDVRLEAIVGDSRRWKSSVEESFK